MKRDPMEGDVLEVGNDRRTVKRVFYLGPDLIGVRVWTGGATYQRTATQWRAWAKNAEIVKRGKARLP